MENQALHEGKPLALLGRLGRRGSGLAIGWVVFGGPTRSAPTAGDSGRLGLVGGHFVGMEEGALGSRTLVGMGLAKVMVFITRLVVFLF